MLAQFTYMEHKMKIKVKIYDAETKEETIIEREETAQEKQERIASENAFTLRKSEAEAKEQAKTAAEGKLAALGLTTDDLRALGL